MMINLFTLSWKTLMMIQMRLSIFSPYRFDDLNGGSRGRAPEPYAQQSIRQQPMHLDGYDFNYINKSFINPDEK